MRRSEREVTDKAEVVKIIEKCEVCHLALADNNVPYIVPLNFGYEFVQERLTLYFHGAKEGKKLDIISKNPSACFEMDCSHKLIESDKACHYTMEYESVIGNGVISKCAEDEEKINALRLIMKTYAKEKQFTFSAHAVAAVTIFKLEVSEFTGKCFKKK